MSTAVSFELRVVYVRIHFHLFAVIAQKCSYFRVCQRQLKPFIQLLHVTHTLCVNYRTVPFIFRVVFVKSVTVRVVCCSLLVKEWNTALILKWVKYFYHCMSLTPRWAGKQNSLSFSGVRGEKIKIKMWNRERGAAPIFGRTSFLRGKTCQGKRKSRVISQALDLIFMSSLF